MEGKGIKKMLIIIGCFAISVIGLCMQFFYKGDSSSNVDKNAEEQRNGDETEQLESETVVYEYDYLNTELPTEENESSNELYMGDGGKAAKIYFSNTGLLDQCSMPIAAQAELVEAAQAFLNLNGYQDVTELTVDNDEFIDDDKNVSFTCNMSGYEEKLQVTFSKSESKLMFAIVYIETE